MSQNKRVELLAPAGNIEAFYGAIHAGADAVYLGGSRFGARAYADNFTEEELISCIRYAHLWGRKVYLTVNTLIKESEFGEIFDYLIRPYEAGLDGVIVQDIGVFAFLREHFPDMELHASTQMTVTGRYGAQLLKEMGACRVVPARELSLAEIMQLKKAVGLELECFIHGAMCYCYSGQCLFSSILGGRSGNRGRCAQPCRLPYKVQKGRKQTQECYPLSLKDMCTIEYLPALIASGIDSFKIEGRMKKPEYAAGVTAIYRKYIDAYYEDPKKPFEVLPEDVRRLSCLYIRSERQDGYYQRHNGKEMVTLSQPSYSGSDEALLSEIRRTYLEQRPRIPIIVQGSFREGEAARVTFSLEDLAVTVTGDMVQAAQKQPITRENVAKQLTKLGDSIFCTDSIEIQLDEQVFYPLKEINELRRRAVLQLADQLIHRKGLPVRRQPDENECGQKEVRQKADSQKTDDQKETSQKVNSQKTDDQKETSQKENIQKTDGQKAASQRKNNAAAAWNAVSVRTAEQLEAAMEYASDYRISRIYLDSDLFYELADAREGCAEDSHDSYEGHTMEMLNRLTEKDTCEIILSLPYILRSGDEPYLEKLFRMAGDYGNIIKGFQVRCLEAMGFLEKQKYSGKIYADAGFYIWNKQTEAVWADRLTGFCLPYELKAAEQRSLIGQELLAEKVFYGRIPMMITANCVVHTTEGCQKGRKKEESVQLVDRYQKKFPVVLNCRHCMNTIYNSVPLSLHKEYQQWQSLYPEVAVRLDFTTENREETVQVLAFFHKTAHAGRDGSVNPPYKEYTTGHEKRGVE